MNLKKGLSYVAFGFFFTLVDLNLTLNGTTLNVTPDFIGWILFFLAFDRLGEYTADKIILKWVSSALIFLSAAVWVLELAKPELEIGFVKTLITIVTAVYMFVLFGVLKKIAADYSSYWQSMIGVLRILNPVLEIAFVAVGLLAIFAESTALVGLTAVLGIAALIAAVVTMIVLFQLRKEISRKLDNE